MSRPDQQVIEVLHLEDDDADAALIQRALIRSGLRVTVHRVDSESAFRRALEGRLPDVILADYRLPDFDGVHALRIVREIAPEVPFIFVTGSLGEERAAEALRDGAADYILKDRPSRLPAAITRALREREEQRARTRAEAAVAESEQRFRYAALATRDVIFELEPRTGEVYINDPLRKIWGHENVGTNLEWWVARVHSDDRYRVRASLQRWLASRDDRWAAEYRFQRGDGSYGHAVVHALVLRDGDGQPLRVIGTLQDVTESRRIQEQLDRTQRVESLGRVAATIAHEFNNVLMGIQSAAEILARSAAPETARSGAKISDSVSRGKRVVDEILQMTRIPGPVVQTFDLAEVLHQMRAEIAALSGSAVDVMLDIPAHPVRIRGDRAQIEQVLANLITNARDAMPSGGRLDLRIEETEGGVVLTVADSGCGMPPQVLAHIFEPLFTTKQTGTGLGLAVSHRLLRQNGATIGVDSAVGRGTSFRIEFDSVTEISEPAGGGPPTRGVGPRRVLLVEDDPTVAEGLRLLLEIEGFDTVVIDLGLDAVDAAERSAPDVVLLDLSLPDVGGIQVYDALAGRWPDLPVIFMSGRADVSDLGDRLSQANVGFISKPFDLDVLLACIDRVCGAEGSRDVAAGA